jgi:hypothetical protein
LVVVVRPGIGPEPTAVVAHWRAAVDGLPATRADWVIDVVTTALAECAWQAGGPRPVRTGLDA